MDIRDLAVTRRCASLDELIDVCRPGGAISKKCPSLAADATRKANALKGVLLRLSQQLQEAGPPPTLPRDRQPLYLRLNEQPELRGIAALVGHHGVLEDELYELTKVLAGRYGNDRVSEAMAELTWIERETRRAKLRPEVLRACRPVIGPVPGAEDYERWWTGKGGPPAPRPAEPEGRKRARRGGRNEGRKARKTPAPPD